MSPQSGGHKSDQLERAGSPKQSLRSLSEVPSIATANRFEPLGATSNAAEAVASLPIRDRRELEATGTMNDSATMSVTPIRSSQAPASSGSKSQPARRQTEPSSEGVQMHPEQRPVISRVSTYRSHALVDSTSEASSGKKTTDGTAKAQLEGQTRSPETHAPNQAQCQDLVVATEQQPPEPAHVQAWRAAGHPNCETCGKRHPPPCKPELVAESQQRAQKKRQRKEQRRQQIAEEQQERQNKRKLQLVNRPRALNEAEAYQIWPELAPSGPPPPPPPQTSQAAIEQQRIADIASIFRSSHGAHGVRDRSNNVMHTLIAHMSEETKYRALMSVLGYQSMPSMLSQQSGTQTSTEATRGTTAGPSQSIAAAGTTGNTAVATGPSTGSPSNQQIETPQATQGTISAHEPDGQRPPGIGKGKQPQK